MRIFIAVLVLIFGLQSWAKADGINEFQIEGISIGDSLLDHFSNSEIMNSKHFYYPSSKKFFQINFWRVSDFKTYEHLTVLVKANDKNYIIYELSGYIDYKKSISKCYNKSKIVISDIKNYLSYKDFHDFGKQKKLIDKTGESTITTGQFFFNDGGVIKVSCHDWSAKYEEKGEIDSLNVSIASKEAFDWFVDEAY